MSTGKMHISEAPLHFSDASKNFGIQFRDSWTEPQGTDDMNIAVLFTALCTVHSEKKVFQDDFFQKEYLHSQLCILTLILMTLARNVAIKCIILNSQIPRSALYFL